MNQPWTQGPRELLQHAVEHLTMGSDFDHRIAMISIDNAVELMIKTYLGLPERARGSKGPSRRELEHASESFPVLLDMLESFGLSKVAGLQLDYIEWFHRLRNQLYHSGNGITVARSIVVSYLDLANDLFRSLFSGHDYTVYNGARMVATWPEKIEEAQLQTRYIISGVEYARIRWGDEPDYQGDYKQACPDCAVLLGQYHVPSCDMERCPVCNEQALSCDCEYENDDDSQDF